MEKDIIFNLTYYFQVENDYNTPVSLKRSLSDPEIYFPSAVRHSLIVAVNGIMPHERPVANGTALARSLNGVQSTAGTGGDAVAKTSRSKSDRYLPSQASRGGGESSLQIDINVIQPTPNISPSHSLRSFSVEDRDALDPGAFSGSDTFAGIPFLIVPPSPVRIRRVSFSDHSQSSGDDENISLCVPGTAPDISISGVQDEEENVAASTSTASQRRARCVRQASLQVMLSQRS